MWKSLETLVANLFSSFLPRRKNNTEKTEAVKQKEIKRFNKIIHVQPDKKKESLWI